MMHREIKQMCLIGTLWWTYTTAETAGYALSLRLPARGRTFTATRSWRCTALRSPTQGPSRWRCRAARGRNPRLPVIAAGKGWDRLYDDQRQGLGVLESLEGTINWGNRLIGGVLKCENADSVG